jgi:hypothetical protein
MKDKQVNMRVSKEDLELINKAKMTMSIGRGKTASIYDLVMELIKEYVNGNESPESRQDNEIVSKDSEQDKSLWDEMDLNLDFNDN